MTTKEQHIIKKIILKKKQIKSIYTQLLKIKKKRGTSKNKYNLKKK